MDGIREEFYSALRREFKEDDFTKSFLYRYLKKEKDDGILRGGSAGSGRDGPYVLLKTSFMELEQGKIRQEECLKKALQILIKNPKLRIDENVRNILWDYGRRLCGGRGLENMRQDRQRYEELLRVLEEGPPAEALGRRDWEKFRGELLKRTLEIDAKTFMYDAGFPLSAERDETIAPRKKDRLLEMLDAYCRENRLLLQRKAFAGQDPYGAQSLSGEQKRRIEAFYRSLKKSPKNERIFIPIRIDPCTGAGLYITGKEYYEHIPSLYKSIKGSCCYALFCLEDIPPEDGWIFLQYSAENEGIYDFPNLDEALSWYTAKCRENGFSYFREVNGPVPADCPEELRAYFQSGQAQDIWAVGELSVSKEEIEAATAECGEPQERRKHNG